MNVSVTSSLLSGSTLLGSASARQRLDIDRQTISVHDLPRPNPTPRPAERIDGLVDTAASQIEVLANAAAHRTQTIREAIHGDKYLIDLYA